MAEPFPRGVGEEMQHHDRERRVDGRRFERDFLRVAAAELDVAYAALARDGFGALEHLGGEIDADYLIRDARELEGERAGAAADIGDDKAARHELLERDGADRKSTRLNSSHRT